MVSKILDKFLKKFPFFTPLLVYKVGGNNKRKNIGSKKIFLCQRRKVTQMKTVKENEIIMDKLKELISKLNENDTMIIRQLYAITYRYLEKRERL